MDIQRLYRMHRLIQQKATGSPDEFAERFHIKRRQLFYLLDELKSYGAQIQYNAAKTTYYYANHFDFFEKTGIEELSGKENLKIWQKLVKNLLECSDDCTGGI
jgi:predicted transcriptional regulator